MMDDFNSDNAKIDSALKAVAASVSAEEAARITAVNGRARIACGNYTGSGSESVSVYCGFRPKLFLVAKQDNSYGYSIAGPYNGAFGRDFQLYVEGASFIRGYLGGDSDGITTYSPNSTGINWRSNASGYQSHLAMNENGKTYCWVAVG